MIQEKNDGFCLTTVGQNAFQASMLEKITLPPSVIKMGYGLFENCWHMQEIHISGNNPSLKLADGVLFSRSGSRLMLHRH